MQHLRNGDNADVIDEFLSCLAVCHTVIPETKTGSNSSYPRFRYLIYSVNYKADEEEEDESYDEEYDEESGKGKDKEKETESLLQEDRGVVGDTIIYQASSPDEGALVTASRRLGYFFHVRKLPFGIVLIIFNLP